ncbi:MAG: hypothetical protein AAF289_17625 [Cyanobacteria bacterium P01_A01_bin.135]
MAFLLLLGPPCVWFTRLARKWKIATTAAWGVLLVILLTASEPEQNAASSSQGREPAIEQATAAPEAEPAPEPRPEALQTSVTLAQEAVSAGQTAQTAADWERVHQLWNEAIAALGRVPSGSSYHELALQKIEEYQGNADYALQARDAVLQRDAEIVAEAERARQAAIAAEEERQQQAAQQAAPQSGPARTPRSGSCDCPYDTDSAGRRCGKRSAYSRPGGASPVCYL